MLHEARTDFVVLLLACLYLLIEGAWSLDAILCAADPCALDGIRELVEDQVLVKRLLDHRPTPRTGPACDEKLTDKIL